MAVDEFVAQLKILLTQQPFAPSQVELTTGESFVVDRRDAVGHNGKCEFAGFLDSAGCPYFFDPRNVAGMTPLTPQLTGA